MKVEVLGQHQQRQGWAAVVILRLRKLGRNSERWNRRSAATQDKQMLEADVRGLISRDFTQEDDIGSAGGGGGVMTHLGYSHRPGTVIHM